MKYIFISLVLATGLATASELEKEIKYLGNNGIEESHQLICVNGKSGIVTINNASQEMQVETDTVSINIGKATFSDAAKLICQ